MAAAHRRQWIPLQKQLQPGARDPANLFQRNARRRHKEAIEKALKKGYLKCLDKELILGSQLKGEGTEELEDVLRISLRGCNVKAIDDIAILTCARLRICNLESCYISDISAFYGCVNLLKLDVSNNQVSSFSLASQIGSSAPSLSGLQLLRDYFSHTHAHGQPLPLNDSSFLFRSKSSLLVTFGPP